MEYTVVLSSIAVVLLVLGVIAFFVFRKKTIQESLNIEEEQKHIIEEAKRKAGNLLKEARLEAKSRLLEMKSDFDSETEETRSELKKKNEDFPKRLRNLINRKINYQNGN